MKESPRKIIKIKVPCPGFRTVGEKHANVGQPKTLKKENLVFTETIKLATWKGRGVHHTTEYLNRIILERSQVDLEY